ncbi:MAG: hypothetical protein MJ051_04070 [Akkermansia sp.]|nr:hypothetical protein [Akkermansia sp.]
MTAALLCLALSLLMHTALATLLLLLPENAKKTPQTPRAGMARMVQVVRVKAEARPDEKERPKTPTAEKSEQPFAKTSADTPRQRPEHADFEGARDTRAMSDPTARDRRSEAEAPAQYGRERTDEEEIVTFDQDRQEGDLAYEGKQQTPPAPAEPTTADEHPAQPTPPPAEGSPESERTEGRGTLSGRARAMLTTSPLQEDLFGELKLTDRPAETEREDGESAARGLADSDGESAEPTQPQRAARRRFYDPALSAEAQQPGFRTEERRTRSSGRFIFGKGAALNVAATPRGRYEAEIYRRVARLWYAACDDHRGDIIPGRLTISLRLDRHGHLVNMHLLSRSGASVSQQSFTFAAIRRAALPAMPVPVQAEMVGELLELIFTFHFD